MNYVTRIQTVFTALWRRRTVLLIRVMVPVVSSSSDGGDFDSSSRNSAAAGTGCSWSCVMNLRLLFRLRWKFLQIMFQ